MFSLRRYEVEDGSVALSEATEEQSDDQFNYQQFALWHMAASLKPAVNGDPAEV